MNTIPYRYPFPLPNGTSVVGPVTLGYVITGNQIVFLNRPEDGNFSFVLRVRATEPDDTVFEDSAEVEFEGHTANLEGYDAAYIRCHLKHAVPTRPSPIFDLTDLGKVIDIIHFYATSDVPEAGDILAATRLAYGRAFDRALALRELARIDLTREGRLIG